MKIAILIRRRGPGRLARSVIWGLAAGLFAVSLAIAGQESRLPSKAESADSFDAQLKEVTVDLGPSPYYPDDHDMRSTLSCYYFPHLMIKEYDQHGVGAEWLSILRRRGKLPECKLSHESDERVIEWEGYFMGVKGNLVLFAGGEIQFGKLPFAVYDSTTTKKLFEDDADATSRPRPSRLRVISTPAGYVLRYLRVVDADCNLHAEGKACWQRMKAKFDVKSDHMPVCTGYDTIAKLVGTDDVESIIAYPVEVTLSPHPVIRTVAGPSKCWPHN